MSDDFVMRLRLQSVLAYRDLCNAVRRSGRENVGFALFLLFLAYLAFENNPVVGLPLIIQLAIYGFLALCELFVGLFKWFFPSAEGVLLDGVVLLLFAGYNLLGLIVGAQTPPWVVLLGLFLLMHAFGRFKAYRQLRAIFPERPSAEQLAWFDDLIAEIRAADPESDEHAIDLPAKPHWKAKLLGNTAFFVAIDAKPVWIAGPDDFEILREKMDHGTGRRKGLLRIHGQQYPEFEIADASWANYQKWRAANPLPQTVV